MPASRRGLFFEGLGTDAVQMGMAAGSIVEDLDVVEDVGAGRFGTSLGFLGKVPRGPAAARSAAKKRGPAPKIQQQLEQLSRLPQAKQRAVMLVIDAVLQQQASRKRKPPRKAGIEITLELLVLSTSEH